MVNESRKWFKLTFQSIHFIYVMYKQGELARHAAVTVTVEEYGVLGCNAMADGPTLRRNIPPPSSGTESKTALSLLI
jgi:hypothetical protein